jgi:hypothetical protein
MRTLFRLTDTTSFNFVREVGRQTAGACHQRNMIGPDALSRMTIIGGPEGDDVWQDKGCGKGYEECRG